MRTQGRNTTNPALVGAFAGADDSLGSFIERTSDTESASNRIFKFHDSIAPSDAAVSACRRTLAIADVKPAQIDYLISCTQTPDFNNPGLVSTLLHKLGGLKCPGIELRQMSLGPIYALDLAQKLIRTRQARSVLVSCTDFLSRYFGGLDARDLPSDGAKEAWRVFADGGAAFLVVDEEASAYRQNSDSFFVYKGGKFGQTGMGREAFHCHLPAAKQFPARITADDVRNGRHLPVLAPSVLTSLIGAMKSPFQFDGAACAVTHQVCAGMTEALCAQLNPSNLKFYDVFPRRGHVGSAGIPLALAALPRSHRGDVFSIALFGSGLAWGSAMLEVL